MALATLSQTQPLHHPLHAEIEARLNAGAFEEAQRLLAQLGVGQEHVHASTYFATRILYQRGRLDLEGVIARLSELLRACPDFPEARAMLTAAERGTLSPETKGFNAATLPPPPAENAVGSQPDEDEGDDEDGDRVTEPGDAPSSPPSLEARLKTPQAPGIPRAPLLPRFTPRENVAPSYVPPGDLDLTPPGLDLEPVAPESGRAARPSSPDSGPWNDTVSAPPPSSATSSRRPSPPFIAIDVDPLDDARSAEGARNTAPSPGAARDAAEPPGVFAIATWISERDFERALGAIERLGAESSPELSLLEVRALLGLGRKAAARRSLDRLSRAPLIDPDLRAAAARLLLELGDLDRAETQARRAHTEDPSSELSRLTLAWAVARSDAWLLSPRSASELTELLTDVAPESSAMPTLAYALSALMLLQVSPEAARQAADAALARDASAQDALAIAAVVAQKQRRSADAERLHQRLLDVDAHAADELAATLTSLGLALGGRAGSKEARSQPPAVNARPAPAPLFAPSKLGAALASSPWDDKEQRLALGDGKAALFDFEQGLARRIEAVPARATADELSFAAMLTARYLTEAPVSRHFAPYDLSLFSIARLDVALGLIYRGAVGPRTELRARVLLGLGAYAGECLRQAYAGEWVGVTTDLRSLHIEGQGLCFAPFRDMDARLQRAEPLQVGDTPLPHPGAEPLGQRVALDVAPPTPWAPAAWPDAVQLPELGARLLESPVGLYCESVELPLDLSFASLRSIDRYVTLLAPPLAPPDPEASWVRRAAVLVGAYIGEVLRATRSGQWELTRGELRPEAYRISLPGGAKALPIAAAFERLSGRRLEQPSDYARRITG
jgi:tetratricopeptide (TPR) repeat protein